MISYPHCPLVTIHMYLESMGIVDVSRYLLSTLVLVSDKNDSSHLAIPVSFFSFGQRLEQRTQVYWLTCTAEDTAGGREVNAYI